MKRLATLLLLALVLLFAGVASLPWTQGGTAFLVAQLNRLEILDIELASGQLAGEFELAHAHIRSGGTQVELRHIRANLNASCLWRSAVCFDFLEATALNVTVLEGEEKATADEAEYEARERALLHWPVRVEISRLSIDKVHVQLPGGHWEQGALNAAVMMFDSVLQVDGANLLDASLVVNEPAEADENDAGTLGLPELYLPFDLQLNGLELLGLEASIRGQKQLFERLALSGRWREQKLGLEDLQLQSPWGNANLIGELAFTGLWPLDVTAEVPAMGAGGYGEHRVEIGVSGDLGRTHVQVAVQGALALSVDADIQVLEPGLPFRGGVTMALAEELSPVDLFGLPASLAEVELSSPVLGQVEGTLSRQLFTVEAEIGGLGYEQMHIRVEGGHRDGIVRIDELLLRDSSTDSEVQASAELAYGENLRLSASLNSMGLSLPALNPDVNGRIAGSARIAATFDSGQWQLGVESLDLFGEVNELPALLGGYGEIHEDGGLGLTRLGGQINGAQLKLENTRERGAILTLQVDEFARWRAGSRGGLSLAARRLPGSNRFSVEGELIQPGYKGLDAARGSIGGSFTTALEQFDLAVELHDPAYGQGHLESLSLTARGGLAAHSVSLSAKGGMHGQLNLQGESTAGEWKGILAPARLDARQGQWRLDEAVKLAWQGSELAIAGHCWRHPELVLCVDDTRLGASGELQLSSMGSLAGLNGLLPSDMEIAGEVEASLEASWADDRPLRMKGRGESREVTVTRHFGLGDSVTIGWDGLSARVDADESGLQLEAEIVQGRERVLALETALPRDRSEAISGRIVIEQLQVHGAAPWAPQLSHLEGVLDGELELSGTVDAPKVTGPVALTGGKLALVGNPTEITDLSMRGVLSGDRANISGRALLGGGELDVQGELLIDPDLQLDLHVVGSNHEMLMPPSAELVVSEELEITVVPGLIDIKGDIHVLEGVIRHEQLPAGSVALSQDVIEVDLAGNPLGQGSPRQIRSDVWVRLPDDKLRVVGDSLTATVGGDLHLRQGPGQPLQLFGTLTIFGGELRAYRQQLVIRRGTVAFSGSPENPGLDVRAERELREEGITVGASLQGSLTEPRLDVYSDPPMSQGEAMSYLVRGRGLDSGAGADGTALALAMGANVVNQSGILTSVNRLPGISNVSFGSTGTDDDTAATVSGYLGDRVYLSYGIGLYEPINVLTARFYLQARLWVEVVSRLENSLDIYYSFDID